MRSPAKTSASETCVESGTAISRSVAASERRARRPETPARGLRDRAADDASRLRFLAEERAPPEPEREQSGDGNEEKDESGRLGRGAFDGPLTEQPPCPEEQQHRDTPGRETHQSVERGRERGAEAADPVIRRGGFPSRRDREEVGVARIVREKREGRQNADEDEKDPQGFACDPAAPESSLRQSYPLSDKVSSLMFQVSGEAPCHPLHLERAWIGILRPET